MTTALSPLLDSRLGRAQHLWRVIRRATIVNVRARMEYRADFVISILYGILWHTSALAFASVLLARFEALGDFPTKGLLLLVGMRLTSHGLYALLFDNFMLLPTLVDDGRMEVYFRRPLSVFTQVLLSTFNMNALGDLAVGITTCGLGIALADLDWTIGAALYMTCAIVSGMLIEAAIQIMLACLLLRSPGSRSLPLWVEEVLSTFGNYPLSILPTAVRGLFTFVVPLAFVAYLPATVLLDKVPYHGIALVVAQWSPIVGFLLFMAAKWIWRWSLRSYRTVGG